MKADDPIELFQALRTVAVRRGNAPAMTFLDASLTPRRYSSSNLFACVDDHATRLERLGLPPASLVGILAVSQEVQVIHYLAALACGVVPAILTPPNRKLDRRHYAKTMAAVLETCRFAAIISELDDISGTSMIVEPGTLRCTRRAGGHARPPAVPGAFLQFSSGTTGFKRGVPVTAAAALAQMATYAKAISLEEDDCILSWLPLYHDMGFMTAVNMALASGAHSVMMQPLDWVANPCMYVKAASITGATLGWHPNFAFSLMAERAEDEDVSGLDLSRLRGLVNCSEPVTYTSQHRFQSRFAGCGLRDDVFWGCYAMAETVFALTHGTSADPGCLDVIGPDGSVRRRPGEPFVSVGRPVPGVELRLIDANGRDCADRVAGEVLVRCPFLFSGYYNDPAATQSAFSGGWYRTGDLGYRAEGQYFISGRSKDLIIVGGVNLHPSDIEEVAGDVAGVHPGRVAAFGLFDHAAQTERVVVLAEADTGSASYQEMSQAIRAALVSTFQLTAFDVHVVANGWLVKSSSGKVARNANREKWTAA